MKRWRLLEKKRNKSVNPQLLLAYLEILNNWGFYSGDCDDHYCSFCSGWDQWAKEHDSSCIVLKADSYIKKYKV